jgi:hypothetical protein
VVIEPGPAAAARALPEPAVTAEPPTYPPTPRPETGGETPRVFRPEKAGLEAEAEKNMVRTFHALGLDTRRIRTFDDMKAAAQELGLDPQALLAGAAKRPLADAEVVALRNLINDAATSAQESSARLSSGAAMSDMERAAVAASTEAAQRQLVAALKRLHVGGTETGRAVAAFRIIGQRNLVPAYWLLTAERQLRGRPMTPEITQAVTALAVAGDRVGLARLMASLHNSTKTEKAITLWKAGLLTNTVTDVANVTGNVFMRSMENTSALPATLFDWMLGLATGRRTKALAPQVLAAQARGAVGGVRKAVEYLRHGDLAEDLLSKYDFNRGTNFDTPALQFYTQAVFRRLGAEDVLFREPALQGSIAEQAVLQARNAGLHGAAFLARVRDLIKSPTARMTEIARSEADYATFQKDNPLASWLGRAPQKVKTGVEVVMPFRRTPLNIADAVLDYSPFGMPKAAINYIAQRRVGDQYLRQKHFVEGLGRSITGTTLAGLGWAAAKAGFAVGLPPSSVADRNNRRARGIPNNSVLVGGKYITLDRLAPASNIFLLGVNAAEQFERQPTLSGKFAGSGFAAVRVFGEQPFIKGVKDVGAAARDPERFGGHFVEGLVASVVPSLVGAVARGMTTDQRIVEGVPQAVMARVPGLRGMLPRQVDARGRVVPAPKGLAASLLSPVTVAPQDTSAVARGLAASGYGPTLPSDAITVARGRKAQVKGQQSERFKIESGQALEEQLQALVSQPGFFDLPPEEQRERMEDVARRARTPVRRRFAAELRMKNAPVAQGGTR